MSSSQIKGKSACTHKTFIVVYHVSQVSNQCSGDRPVCDRCHNSSKTCTYDVIEGRTRLQDLRSQLEQLQNHVDDLELILQALRDKSIEDAIEILASLRVGQDVQELSRRLHGQVMLEPRPDEL